MEPISSVGNGIFRAVLAQIFSQRNQQEEAIMKKEGELNEGKESINEKNWKIKGMKSKKEE